MLIQQGDVLIIRVKKVPTGAAVVAREKRGLVLAEGEAMGHAHVIGNKGVTMMIFKRQRFLVADRPFRVRHEEHRPVTVPAGVYRVSRVREYDHLTDQVREVGD